MKLVKDIYAVTSHFPDSEKYGLTNQMNRAVVSIPSNIAEGCSRSSTKEFIRFIDISLGSSFELETQLLIAKEFQWVDSDNQRSVSERLGNTQKSINAYRNYLKREIDK